MASLPTAFRPMSFYWVGYLRTWKGDIGATFVAPVLYLASLGLGVGSLIGHGGRVASLHGTYLSFVAPALLATTAMQLALVRGTYDVWSACNPWSGAYRSMQATPLSTTGILVGHMTWVACRLAMASACYLAVSAAFGTVHSPEAVLTLLVGPLVGLAFAVPVAAYSVTARTDAPFSMVFRLLMVPLFLFSGTFFPLSQMPVGLQWAANVLPLWHGVQLCRGLYVGDLGFGTAAADLAYLIGLTLAGYLVARRTYAWRLSK